MLIRHENQCWVDEIGYMNNGETKRTPKQCSEVTCDKGGAYTINGCISVHVEPPCTVGEGDLSKPYPDCCFEVKCPENKATK
ncbi:hypothetical protein HHI36_023356 [Cryptolaemus montrouzieri]|uniref:Single domain-containing protein n=1 Tax=Cryptolaemus montrouzieri TaxID=559131 RepID=A0ABD2PGX8_9CUCU